MLLHYPCTDVDRGDLQYPGELFAISLHVGEWS